MDGDKRQCHNMQQHSRKRRTVRTNETEQMNSQNYNCNFLKISKSYQFSVIMPSTKVAHRKRSGGNVTVEVMEGQHS